MVKIDVTDMEMVAARNPAARFSRFFLPKLRDAVTRIATYEARKATMSHLRGAVLMNRPSATVRHLLKRVRRAGGA